jgi:hypothetical protein
MVVQASCGCDEWWRLFNGKPLTLRGFNINIIIPTATYNLCLKKKTNTVYQFCFSFSEQKRQHLYRQQNITYKIKYLNCKQEFYILCNN